ncbi:MAG: Gp19/Gp15/Gp42 family protein [Lactimicrobium massiliense]|nr:Gp19/Gp15/Gp42 family protein [Lactimicrobium massiliense]MDD6561371.1 Gp19/Gp15/Gp42 family protein [Lactimicrobium massiliense]
MNDFAEVDDIIKLKGRLTDDQLEKARAYLPIVSDTLRFEAEKAGKDLDYETEKSPAYKNVLKSVTVDIVYRAVIESEQSSASSSALSQVTESALGYSLTGTFANAGGGLFIKKSELARLGLKRQRYGFVDLYGIGDSDEHD